MGQPAAKQGDKAVGVDIHVVMVPAPPGSPVPTPLPHPFNGILDTNLSVDVKIDGMAAATVGSIATNTPPHIPTPPGVSFQAPPSNK
ncbi:MAG TPA: PAAR domain-containing protein, partial [Allosphingosinicella sp.]|nr:PAAR domain-containing protein [Allosphingosinicella sp.]